MLPTAVPSPRNKSRGRSDKKESNMKKPLKLMRCRTCQESNIVNRPEIVAKIPATIYAMRKVASSLVQGRSEDFSKLADMINFWADELEGK
jgi:hypothetical protein